MDVITTGIIASAVYDILKNGLKLSAIRIKEHLGQWIKEDDVVEAVTEELNRLKFNDEMSEVVIARDLEQSLQITQFINNINMKASTIAPSTVTNVTQTHNGTGDNIAGSKIIQ